MALLTKEALELAASNADLINTLNWWKKTHQKTS